MKPTCTNCAYWSRSIDQWPCDSCRDIDGTMSLFIPDGNDDESGGCNDDYCEIKFFEEE